MRAQAPELGGEPPRPGAVAVDNAVGARERDGLEALPRRAQEEDLEPLDLGPVAALARQPLVGQAAEVLPGAPVARPGLGEPPLERRDPLLPPSERLQQRQHVRVVGHRQRRQRAPLHEPGLQRLHHLLHVRVVPYLVLLADEVAGAVDGADGAAAALGQWHRRRRHRRC